MTSTRTLRRLGTAATAAAALLSLAACGSDKGTSVQQPATTVPATSGPSSTVSVTTAAETTVPASEPASTTPAASSSVAPTTVAGGGTPVTVDPSVQQAIDEVNSLLASNDKDLSDAAAAAANGG